MKNDLELGGWYHTLSRRSDRDKGVYPLARTVTSHIKLTTIM